MSRESESSQEDTVVRSSSGSQSPDIAQEQTQKTSSPAPEAGQTSPAAPDASGSNTQQDNKANKADKEEEEKKDEFKSPLPFELTPQMKLLLVIAAYILAGPIAGVVMYAGAEVADYTIQKQKAEHEKARSDSKKTQVQSKEAHGKSVDPIEKSQAVPGKDQEQTKTQAPDQTKTQAPDVTKNEGQAQGASQQNSGAEKGGFSDLASKFAETSLYVVGAGIAVSLISPPLGGAMLMVGGAALASAGIAYGSYKAGKAAVKGVKAAYNGIQKWRENRKVKTQELEKQKGQGQAQQQEQSVDKSKGQAQQQTVEGPAVSEVQQPAAVAPEPQKPEQGQKFTPEQETAAPQTGPAVSEVQQPAAVAPEAQNPDRGQTTPEQPAAAQTGPEVRQAQAPESPKEIANKVADLMRQHFEKMKQSKMAETSISPSGPAVGQNQTQGQGVRQ